MFYFSKNKLHWNQKKKCYIKCWKCPPLSAMQAFTFFLMSDATRWRLSAVTETVYQTRYCQFVWHKRSKKTGKINWFECVSDADMQHNDCLLHSIHGIELRIVTKGFQEWKVGPVFLATDILKSQLSKTFLTSLNCWKNKSSCKKSQTVHLWLM
jgi:hypothetical protein